MRIGTLLRTRLDHLRNERSTRAQLENVAFRLQETDDLPVDSRTGKFPLVVRADQ